MSLVDFTTYVISGLVKNPDMVKVSALEDDGAITTLEVLVANDDIGMVIGHEGRNAKALRTIIQAHAYLNGLARVKINIDSF